MVKTLNDKYLVETTPTVLKNEVSTLHQMYYVKETSVVVNQSVNGFYTVFLFKIDALTHNFVLILDIAATLFNNLSPDVRELLISEEVQVLPRPPTKTNHQGNHRLPLIINEAAETEKKTRTIKVAV